MPSLLSTRSQVRRRFRNAASISVIVAEDTVGRSEARTALPPPEVELDAQQREAAVVVVAVGPDAQQAAAVVAAVAPDAQLQVVAAVAAEPDAQQAAAMVSD